MIFFHDLTGQQRVLTAEDLRQILNERALLRIKLDNANERAFRHQERCEKAYHDAHLQRVRAERLEAIIDHMNSNLRYLADEADSSLLNDVEVNPSCEKP